MGAVLPPVYGPGVGEQILADFEAAPIPELHKAMFRWVGRFTQESWEMTAADVETLRSHGLSDADIVQWAQIASLQGWWTMSADGGGIPLERGAETGPVLQKPREFYESAPEGLTAAEPGGALRGESPSGLAWVDVDLESDAYREAAAWAESHFGLVPNLFRAVSLRPECLRRHCIALELLERPQTPRLTPRAHALVRALVAGLNRSAYWLPTVRAQLERVCAGDAEELFAAVTADYRAFDWEPDERVVLDFAHKLTRHAYKITEKDALAFRESGLGDEAYVDVLNTAAIQTSFDRLTHALGVAPDPQPLVPR